MAHQNPENPNLADQQPEENPNETLYERLMRKLAEEQATAGANAGLATHEAPPSWRNEGFSVDEPLARPGPQPAHEHLSGPEKKPAGAEGWNPTASPERSPAAPQGPAPQPPDFIAASLRFSGPEPMPEAIPPAGPLERSRKPSIVAYLKSKDFWFTFGLFVGGGFVVLLLFFQLALPMLTKKGSSLSVPRVINLNIDDAVRILDDAGLAYVVDSQYEPNMPPFTVLRQDPRNMARVKPGRTINLVVARHRPPTVLIPKIINVDVQQATYLLNSWGLKVGSLTYMAGNEPDVVKKALQDGQPVEENDLVLVGSSIDLVISRGVSRGKVRLPDVLGLPLIDAIAVLKNSGLEVGTPRYAMSGSGAEGTVTFMSPRPRDIDSVQIGTVIEITVRGQGPFNPSEGGPEGIAE